MILSEPLTKTLTNLLRDVVDVYNWNGLTVARKWPTKSKQPLTSGTLRGNAVMQAAHNWRRTIQSPQANDWRTVLTPDGRSEYDTQQHIGLRLGYTNYTYVTTDTPDFAVFSPLAIVAITHTQNIPLGITEARLYYYPSHIDTLPPINFYVTDGNVMPQAFRYVYAQQDFNDPTLQKRLWSFNWADWVNATLVHWDDVNYTIDIEIPDLLTDFSVVTLASTFTDHPKVDESLPLAPPYATARIPTTPHTPWPPPEGADPTDYYPY